jgi:hypothetical protein
MDPRVKAIAESLLTRFNWELLEGHVIDEDQRVTLTHEGTSSRPIVTIVGLVADGATRQLGVIAKDDDPPIMISVEAYKRIAKALDMSAFAFMSFVA